MKLLIVIMLAVILQARAEATFAQKITLIEENAKLSDVIKKIRKQSGYDFIIYNLDLINSFRGITVKIKNGPVEQALNQALNGLPLKYTIEDKFVVLSHADQKNSPITKSELQDTIIRGKVLEKNTKKAIPGANVANNNGRWSTYTNTNGEFSIRADIGSTIVVSFVGYKQQTIQVKSRTSSLTILMEESENNMQDVVVNGIFSRKAETATGSQTTVNREQLLKAGTVNIIQSLRNIDPSFSISENRAAGSNPNSLPDISIRGQSGLPDLNGDYATNPNLPLFILDGFETTLQRVVDLDMYRVASVTLLKDAASKAIYGAKAANGVVVVETIRPQPGQLRIQYNSSIGYEMPDLSSYNLTNAREKLQAEVLAGVYSGTTPPNQVSLMQQYNSFLNNIERGVETDWMAKPLRNGIRQTHSLGFSGGDERFTYGVTANYNGNQGVMKGSSANVFTGNLNLMYRIGSFNFRNDLTVGTRKGTNSPWGSFGQYSAMNPYLSYTDANGQISQTVILRSVNDPNPGYSMANNVATYNPAYNATLNTFDINKSTTITNNTSVDWMIRPGFRLNGRFSISRQNDEADLYLPAGHNSFITQTDLARRGSYQKNNGAYDNYDGQVNLSYSKILGPHAITANGGASISENSNVRNGFITEGFPNDRIAFPSLGLQYQLNSRPSGAENITRDMGFFLSSNYSYDQRYNLDLTYRTNQSSQYGANNRWGQFWSTGVSWNLHNETFVKEISFIDQLRLRASTGYTGSQGFNTYLGIGSYAYERELTYSNGNGAYLMALANPDLKWQRRQDHNLGLDFAFLRKFSGRAEYGIGYTSGLLTDITLPTSTGFSSYKANLGRVQNKTIELNLTYNVFQNAQKRNSLSIFASIAQNRNKLLEISNSLSAYNKRQNDLSNGSINNLGGDFNSRDAAYKASLASITRPKVLFVEGQSMNAIYAVPSLGIDPATGRERYLKLDGSTTYVWDVNDQVVVGNSLPDWQGNFGFNLNYMGFRANAIFRVEFGGQLYNQTLVNRVENADIYRNIDVRVLTDRWQKPGDVAFFKSITDRTATRVSSRFVEDNNTLSLGSVQLGYDLDRIVAVKKLGFSQLRASVTSSELFQISSMRIERGTDYPFARTVQFTINANF